MELALSAARWVLDKALAPVTEGLLEAWAASKNLGAEMDALKVELHYAQAIINHTHDREIDNPDLEKLLLMMRLSVYDGEDVLDELDYFRIKDELDGTSKASNEHARGCARDFLLHARATARSVSDKLKLISSGSRHAPGEQEEGDDDDDGDDARQGCLPKGGILCSSCGGCMPKVVVSAARNTANAVGKRFPCCSSISVDDDTPTDMLEDPDMPADRGQPFLCGVWRSKAQQLPELKFSRVAISEKMKEITRKLNPVCTRVSSILNLELGSKGVTTTAMERPMTTDEITEPKLYGRETKLQGVVDNIIHGEWCANELTVLPIVGPGGIGKTTFIQHVYKEVKSHFQVSIWICVSQSFNANRLAREVKKQMPKVQGEEKYHSDHEIIEQRSKGKRFLLVLDDMWKYHEGEWKKLLAPFRKGGAKGNMVIVTTRIPDVAKMVTETLDHPMELERLEEHDLMCFFEECVFGRTEPWTTHPDLHDIGVEIVKKLKGSPLAAKTVGRLLKNELTRKYWTRVLESKEWELQSNPEDIMPALKISYDYLPLNLKLCFSYCALFPEDYEFDSKELIHFWMGLDILHLGDQGRRIEDVGQSYLTNLVNYGFFKKNKKDNGYHYYVIHDLLHELAVKVSSYECLSIHISKVWSIQIPASVRHLSITVDKEDVKDRIIFKARARDVSSLGKRMKIENLRTLMLFGENVESFAKTFGSLFKEARALRTILLSGTSHNVEDMLQNFSKFVHLRYLKIRRHNLEISLPGSISRLYHLKILDVGDCKCCSGPSRDLNNLVKLHHFITPSDSWGGDYSHHSDIFKVGKLKLLRDLGRFEVKKESNGFELKELGQLLELEKLGIYNLEKVEGKEEAFKVKLMQKQHLQELILDWDTNHPNKDPMHEDSILESLRPHSNLYRLSIKGHGGATCPSWLGENLSVKELEYLQLSSLSWENLPPLGEFLFVDEHGQENPRHIKGQSFTNLKSLELVKIPKLKKWIGNGPTEVLSHLEFLTIRECPELVELPFSHQAGCEQPKHEGNMTCFPKLQKLVITDCPKLSSLPCIPWSSNARYAHITHVRGLQSLLYVEGFNLQIEGKDALDSSIWRVLAFHNLSKVKNMTVSLCPPLPLDHLKMLSSLESIDINFSTSWEGWTRILPHFPKLLNIWVFCSETLTGLGVVGQQKKTEEPALPPASSINKVEAQIGQAKPQPQPQPDARGEEEIAAATSAGLLMLPSHIQTLDISSCPNLVLLMLPSHIQTLHISSCPNLVFCPGSPDDDKDEGPTGGGGGGCQGLSSLRRLWIQGCPRFFSSSSSFSFPSSTEDILLNKVDMETLLPVLNCSSLTTLRIMSCPDLRGEGLWPLLTQGQLTRLFVRCAPKLFADIQTIESHSSKLPELDTDDVAGVLAAPICTFLAPSLTDLAISENNEVERFTKEQEEALRLLTCLENLQFCLCDKLQSLPSGLHTLPKLKTLCIRFCPAIRSQLKVDDLPSSLQELNVQDSESNKLRRQCRKFIGTIPIVKA